jgi:hypothetical protein
MRSAETLKAAVSHQHKAEPDERNRDIEQEPNRERKCDRLTAFDAACTQSEDHGRLECVDVAGRRRDDRDEARQHGEEERLDRVDTEVE